jgi:hypothetical protein
VKIRLIRVIRVPFLAYNSIDRSLISRET